MPRKFFKRLMPDLHKLRDHKSLRIFGKLLHDPNLWHLNRYSVSGAVAVGLFMAFLPLPTQMIPAAAAAILLHVNLPIALMLTWITNPFTTVPILYLDYKLGSVMLGRVPQNIVFEPTWEWLWSKLHLIWQPVLLGSLTVGIVCAVSGYFLTRGLWRLHVVQNWDNRKKMRQTRLRGKLTSDDDTV
jgi:uncharacterized protein (DUF2062 family)